MQPLRSEILKRALACLLLSLVSVTSQSAAEQTEQRPEKSVAAVSETQQKHDAWFAGYEITQTLPGLENTLLEVILGTCAFDDVTNLNQWSGYVSVTGTFSDETGSPIGGPIDLVGAFALPDDELMLVPLGPGLPMETGPQPLTLKGAWTPVPECPFRITSQIELSLTLDPKKQTMRMVGRTLSGTQCPCVGPCYPAFAAMGPFDVEVPLHPAECTYVLKIMKEKLGN